MATVIAPAAMPATKGSRASLVAVAVLAAVLFVAPLVGIYPVFLMKALCFALFACAFNLLLGYGGLLSFGHAMFLGSAGYICAHAAKVWGWPPEAAILAGTLAATVLGGVVGVVAIRRRGMLFGIIDLSRGLAMYYTVLVIFVLGYLLIYRIVYSPFGQVLKAIKENEPRAISLGYDAERYKLMAFILSAALSGLAGSTKAIVFQLASLTDVHWTMSGEVVLMVLLGGMGTIFGPVVGAFMLIGLESFLSSGVTIGGMLFGPEWVPVITGAIFVVCVLSFRRGVVGEIAAWYARRRDR